MLKKYEEYLLFEKKYTHKELNSKFWNNLEFNQEIRKKLLKIANDFYESLDINIPIDTIKLTGSIANYNYHKDSDLDVHIIIDFNEYDGEKDILLNLLQSKTFIWNLKHDINIKGADVELYIQDKSEKHISTGLFSLTDNEWVKEPKYTDPDVDEDDVKLKYEKWVYDINRITDSITDDSLTINDKKDYYNKSEKLKKKLKKFRQKGLNDNGEFSTENVAFKKLRNDGYIKKLYDSNIKYYDLMFSQ